MEKIAGCHQSRPLLYVEQKGETRMLLGGDQMLRKICDCGFLVLACITLVSVGFKQVNAAPGAIPRPGPSPNPSQPKPQVPTPIPSPDPQQPIWVVKGEVQNVAGEYVCQIRCKEHWRGEEMQILQSTRGGEDWKSGDGEMSTCMVYGGQHPSLILHGGHWDSPPDTPEDSLCFLVLSESASHS